MLPSFLLGLETKKGRKTPEYLFFKKDKAELRPRLN
jgi:hypothetical protein|tara:strand:+ start:1007 stop:1114 length:108 start_codon:yes stop_codon:yes gene_type:complete